MIQQLLVTSGGSRNHGHRKGFSRGGTTRRFQNCSRGGSKSGKNCFFPVETKQPPFLLKFSKSRGLRPPSSDAHGRSWTTALCFVMKGNAWWNPIFLLVVTIVANYSPRRHSLRKLTYLRKTCWFGRMQHIPKQSHYVRCRSLGLLCNSLCGPWTKKFGDPALHHNKQMKVVKPFAPHLIAWSVRNGFNQSICRTKEQETRLQCLACAMSKPVMAFAISS